MLGAVLPARLVRSWLASATRLSGALMPPGVSGALEGLAESSRLAEIGDARLRQLGQTLSHWPVQPAGSEGYRKGAHQSGFPGAVHAAEAGPERSHVHDV